MLKRVAIMAGIILGIIAPAIVNAGGNGIVGDADCSAFVDSRDAAVILQADVGLLPVSYLCADTADVDGNGRINPIDALLILQYDAGIIDALPQV